VGWREGSPLLPCLAFDESCRTKPLRGGVEVDPCESEVDRCMSEVDRCESEVDRCAVEVDRCAVEADPCESEVDRCESEVDPCAVEVDPCVSNEAASLGANSCRLSVMVGKSTGHAEIGSSLPRPCACPAEVVVGAGPRLVPVSGGGGARRHGGAAGRRLPRRDRRDALAALLAGRLLRRGAGVLQPAGGAAGSRAADVLPDGGGRAGGPDRRSDADAVQHRSGHPAGGLWTGRGGGAAGGAGGAGVGSGCATRRGARVEGGAPVHDAAAV
jgi:hypothetical protein